MESRSPGGRSRRGGRGLQLHWDGLSSNNQPRKLQCRRQPMPPSSEHTAHSFPLLELPLELVISSPQQVRCGDWRMDDALCPGHHPDDPQRGFLMRAGVSDLLCAWVSTHPLKRFLTKGLLSRTVHQNRLGRRTDFKASGVTLWSLDRAGTSWWQESRPASRSTLVNPAVDSGGYPGGPRAADSPSACSEQL